MPNTTKDQPIGWLHLTDVHVGQPHDGGRLANIEASFRADVTQLIGDSRQPIDVVFLTGDIAWRGRREEFTRATAMLGRICNTIRAANAAIGFDTVPVLVPAPGNHDLDRPGASSAQRLRDAFAKREPSSPALWQGLAEERQVVDASFGNYLEWIQHHPLPFPRGMRHGVVPGDIAASVLVRGLRLGVVGLNATYLHVGDTTPGSLHVDFSQLTELVGRAPDRWTASHHVCVLLTHHPPHWLLPAARQILDQEINPAQCFDLHLFGHEHQGSHRQSPGPGGIKHLGEGRSLFAAEEAGWPRLHGYSHGAFQLTPSSPGSTRFDKSMTWSTRQGWSSSHGWQFDAATSRWGRWRIQVELAPSRLSKATTKAPAPPTLHAALGDFETAGRTCWTTFSERQGLWRHLAGHPRRWIYLAASEPTARGTAQRRAEAQEQERVRTARLEVIRDAVTRLARAVRDDDRFGLVFGGHPSITTLLAPLALTGNRREPWLCLVQDEFYWRDLIEDVGVLAVTPGVLPMLMTNDTGDADLERMRRSMLGPKLAAAVFVGGLKGVLEEFEATPNSVPRFAIAAGGGAAAEPLLRAKWQDAAGRTGRHAGLANPGPLWQSAEAAVAAILTAIRAPARIRARR